MKFGICTIDPQLAADARDAGFDYLEAPVPALQKPLEGEETFLRAMEEASGLALPVEVSNGFFGFDGSLRCVGPDADLKRLEGYFSAFFATLSKIGYDGRISLECRFPPPEGRVEILRRALASMKAATGASLS